MSSHQPVKVFRDDDRILSAFAFSWKAWAVAFAATVLVLSSKYYEPYFVRPIYEQDDFAANALSIRNAGVLQETLGNYSRWHFRHPGPVMFYAYAAGEIVFHSFLHLTPAEHNAHVFTGMLVQSAFWAAVFGLLASWGFSLRTLCLIWIAGWIHFSLSQHAFVSIWPPHVLLMPFVCYAIACASVAAGQIKHLWILIPTGLVLVHGHVAQPLTVGLFGLFAVGGAALLKIRGSPLELPVGRGLLIWGGALVLAIALLLLPIVVDLTLWPNSNVNAILDYVSKNKHDTKSVAQSLDYLLQFSRYWGFHDEPGKVLFQTVHTHAYYFIGWCVLLLLAGRFCFTKSSWSDHRKYQLVISIMAIFGLGMVAAIYWGTRMAGPMFAFNGFYFYGLYFLAACIALIGLSELRLPPKSVFNLVVLGCVVVVPWTFKARPLLSDTPPGTEVRAGIDGLVKHGRLSLDRPYILSFFPHLGSAVTVMNTLDRMGVEVSVPQSGEWVMGRRFALPAQGFLTQPEILQLTPSSPARAGDLVVYDQGRLTIERQRHDPAAFPLTVDFYATPGVGVSGMTSNGIDAPWSLDDQADILLMTLPTAADVRVTLTWAALLGPLNQDARRVIVQVEGVEDQRFSVTQLRSDSFVIPAEIWNQKVRRDGFIQLHFLFLDPISPKQCGLNDDPRPLSLSFRGLVFDTVK